MLSSLKDDINSIAQRYQRLGDVREKIILNNRKIISLSSEIIHLLHKSNYSPIEELIKEVDGLVSATLDYLEEIDGISEKCLLLKIIRDGVREYVEANLLYEYVLNKDRVLDERVYGLVADSIIEGIFEFSGELRRLFLKKLIERDLESARGILDFLESLYNQLSMITVKGYFISSYKRRLDMLRAQLDKSLENYIFAQYSKG